MQQIEQPPPANESKYLPQRYTNRLPSEEVLDTLGAELDDEIDLRELLDVLIRRKWLILSVLFLCFFVAALYTFTRTPQFNAIGSIKIAQQVNTVTKFDNLESTALKTMEFQQTQVEMLKSEQLANRVIASLSLSQQPLFNNEVKDNAEESTGMFSHLRGLIRSENPGAHARAILPEEEQERITQNSILKIFNGRFGVSPVKNSELVRISFFSPDPKLSADIVNAGMDAFIDMHMDGNIKASQDAARYLDKQIQSAQIKLEKSEQDLQEFARKIGVVSLDPKTNMTFKQMEELNESLAKARADRIAKEGRYLQNRNAASGELTQIMENELIQNLKNQHATLRAEYENLAVTFKADYPKMRQLKARMDDLNSRIMVERQAIFSSIKNEYDTALRVEQELEKQANVQKDRALDLEKVAIQYKIYEREVETNKSIYQSLLQRSKEIEATVGAALTNIQIIDAARPPLYPFKPKVAMNLLLGAALGLMGGVGLAFLTEFFDNTIKGPDEFISRYKISVLGLIPFAKEGDDGRQAIAFKYYQDPRSPVAEAMRTTMTSVRLSAADAQPKTLLITSILPGAGKSSLSVNMALSFLGEGERCLLIDVDLRKPSLHRTFDLPQQSKGLTNVLTGLNKLNEVIVHHEQYHGLDFITSGPLPPNPAELLASKRMRTLLDFVSQRYDRIILDGPPYQGFAEILNLAHIVDGVILISVEGSTPREGVKHFKNSIAHVNGRLLGTIINKSGKNSGLKGYGGYKYYSYNYDYGKAGKA
ncbi:MAG: polysaccharide biosynthesis tyrosine autokinase [bacterium]|nr:polysaccharide biosynthesis tyrosine autokinase [bacterium]